MIKILITGGAGYIGSHTTKYLLDHNYQVVVVDNLSTSSQEAVDKRASFYKVDLRDKTKLLKIFKKENPQAVIHFAAFSVVSHSMKNPLEYFNNNIYSTQILLEVMKETKVNNIVFSSSASVYGKPTKIPVAETAETKPINAYGETKLMIEKMLKYCESAYGLKYISLRYFNAAGADMSTKLGSDHILHLIPDTIQTALGNRPYMDICGDNYNTPDGTCIRDYIHVLDLADAHLKAIEYLFKEKKSNIFNLGSGIGYSVKEIIRTIKLLTNRDFPVIVEERRAGDPDILLASIEKAKMGLKWAPKYKLADIILSAWNYYLN